MGGMTHAKTITVASINNHPIPGFPTKHKEVIMLSREWGMVSKVIIIKPLIIPTNQPIPS